MNSIEGRTSKDEITIFKSVGSAVLDIACADYIIKEAIKLNIGTKIDIYNDIKLNSFPIEG